MDITGEYTIPAPRQQVWDALNDPQVLEACIPGCEALEKVSESEFAAQATMKVGAVKARLKGKVVLSDIEAPNSYTIAGQGQGGVAGFAKGAARVALSDAAEGGTLLRYEATAQLGGKLAAVGSRVLQGVAKKTADDFFGAFAARLSGEAPGEAVPAAVAPAEAPAPAVEAPPTAAPRDFTGTARDLLWFAIGIAVGALVMWALYD
jgi:carbon monoxide dehydrogenase subunit G